MTVKRVPEVTDPAAGSTDAGTPPAPAPGPAPTPSVPAPAPASEVSDAAAALARRKHERAREAADDAPVRMSDLHDLERAVDERLEELARPAPAAPTAAPVVRAPPAAAPVPRRGGAVPWVVAAVLLVVLVVAYVRGTRGGTR